MFKKIRLALLLFFLLINFISDLFAQTPTKCLEIESILVDACVPGTGCTSAAAPNCNCEGKNEMVRFKTGPDSISITDINITWPNNTFRGISPRNNTTDSLIAILQSTIQSPCGALKQPLNGMIPPNTTVLLITSTDMCTGANSFTNLSDTLCVIFQNAGNFQGHFANYNATPGLRTLIMRVTSTGCADTATYERSLLVNVNGTVGGAASLLDGSTVDFSWSGTPNYINRGCQAPFVPFFFDISTLSIIGPNTVCRNDTLNIIASTGGGDIYSIHWNVHDMNNQPINAGVFVNPNGYDIQIAASEFNVQSFYVVAEATGPCNVTIIDSSLITVVNIPDLSVTASGPLTFCQGESVTLNASTSSFFAPNFNWNNGNTNTSITITQSDTLIATSSNVCGDSVLSAIIVNVKPLPVSEAGISQTYCSGDSVQIGTVSTFDYTYTWNTNTGLSDSTISNPYVILTNNTQSQQTYNYTVVSTLNGCSTSDNVSITVNPLPVWDAGSDVSVCSANSTVTLGNQANSNYQYQWSPSSLLASPANTGNPNTIALSADTNLFNVSVTYFGCTLQDSLKVFVLLSPLAFAGNDASYCSGDSVQIGTTATAGYTYSWTSSTGLSNAAVSNPYVVLTNNTSSPITQNYLLTTTLNQCSSADNVNITVNPLPVWDAGSDVSVCSANSTVTLGNQANSNYQYQWSPSSLLASPANTGNPNTIALSADTNLFNVSVTYFGCTLQDSLKVFVLLSPLAFAGNDASYCSGDSVQIGTTATAGYTYSWTSSTGLSNAAVSNPYVVLTNNTSSPITQNYLLTSTLNQCSATDNVNITVNPLPVWDAGSDISVCSSNPIATIGASPVSSYTYNWSPSTFINGSNIISNPLTTALINPSTSFYVTVSLANCSIVDSMTVFVVTSPIAFAGNDTSICSGSTLNIGTSPVVGYNYAWNNPTSLNNSTISNPQFIQTNTGTLPIEVELIQTASLNGSNCQSNDTIYVTINPLPPSNISLSGSAALCTGDSVILSAPANLTTYSWSNGSNQPSITVYAAGTYSLNVTNSYGCSASSPIVIVSLNTRPSIIAVNDGPVCLGQQLNLTAVGTGNLNWTGPNGYTNTGSICTINAATFANAGSYIVTLTGLNGCTNKDTTDVVVNANPTPVITPLGPTSFCQGSSVTINSNYSSGNIWTNGSSNASAVINGSGPVSVTVTDANGCTGTSNTVNVNVLPLPVANITPFGAVSVCNGNPVTLTATSANSYQWSNGATTSSITTSSPGVYSVIVTDANGCVSNPSSPVNVTLVNVTSPVITANGPLSICNGQSVELNSSSSGVNQWSNGSTSQNIVVTIPGIYTVTSTDANGCVATSAPILVTQATGPTANFSVTPATGFMPLNVSISNNSTGNNQSNWDFGNGTTSALQNPSPITYYEVGSYTILLTVSNANGCTDSLSKIIYVESEIPNVFSPNGDGKNDTFKISLGVVSEYSIVIYNRWGQEVFASNDVKNSWGGTVKSGNEAEAGVYYFIINYKSPNGESKEVKNYLTLVR